MRKAEAEQVLGKARGGVYCWQERLEREGLLGLEDRKWRPKRV
jgi:transposase